MTTTSVTTVGVEGFIAGLSHCGVAATRHESVVTFTVVSATASGTREIETGVAVNELATWPAIPPHWLHFPNSVQFARTNANADETLPGWTRHSRDIQNWGNAADAAQAWLAHVRGVLREAL